MERILPLLEDMPFSLLGYSDLETFCHQAIQKLWKDRCYSGTKIGMRFTFTHSLANAA
ncbi:MAG: hypothetical protein HC845_08890 [Akkermansiaceae bacterium]|nr:hypothetical protein [Akkermansiaceae bacterium]